MVKAFEKYVFHLRSNWSARFGLLIIIIVVVDLSGRDLYVGFLGYVINYVVELVLLGHGERSQSVKGVL